MPILVLPTLITPTFPLELFRHSENASELTQLRFFHPRLPWFRGRLHTLSLAFEDTECGHLYIYVLGSSGLSQSLRQFGRVGGGRNQPGTSVV